MTNRLAGNVTRDTFPREKIAARVVADTASLPQTSLERGKVASVVARPDEPFPRLPRGTLDEPTSEQQWDKLRHRCNHAYDDTSSLFLLFHL